MPVHTPPRRAERFWDWTSPAVELVERVPAVRHMHRIMIDSTEVGAGDSVVDLGCGAGAYFAPLRAAVGDTGRVLGVDHSTKATQRAHRRVERHGWDNVTVRDADAVRTDLGHGAFDAIFCMYSLSAMPDIATVVARAHAALRPGGRLFVADVRFVPAGRARAVIKLLDLAYRGMAGAPGEDVVPHMRTGFDSVRLLDGQGAPVGALPSWPPLVMLVATKAV